MSIILTMALLDLKMPFHSVKSARYIEDYAMLVIFVAEHLGYVVGPCVTIDNPHVLKQLPDIC